MKKIVYLLFHLEHKMSSSGLLFVLSFLFSFNLTVRAQEAISPVYFYPSYGLPGGTLQIFGTDFNNTLKVFIGDSQPCEILTISQDKKSMKVKLPEIISTNKIKIFSGENYRFESLGELAVITPPLFLSTPLLEVHYNEPYSYSIINDFVGNSDSNLYPDVIPNWLNYYKDTIVVNGSDTIEYKNFKPIQFGTFGSGISIGGVAEDPFGNVFVIRSSGTEIFEVEYGSENTILWKTGLSAPRGSNIYSLYFSDNFLFIPRNNANNSSVTRILLSDESKTVRTFSNISGGTYSVFQYGGNYYLPSYQSGTINRQKEGGSLELFNLGFSLNGPTAIGFENKSSSIFLGTGQNRSIISLDAKSTSAFATTVFTSNSSNNWVEGFNRTSKGDFYIALTNGGVVRYYPEKDSLAQISLTDTENVRSISNSGRGSVLYTNFASNKLFKLQNWSLLAGTPKKSDVGLHKVILRSNNDAGDGFQEFYIRVVDRIPPKLIEVFPEHQSIHVPVGTRLKLTFDEEIQLGTGGKLSIYAGDSPVPIQTFDLTSTEDRAFLSISNDQLSLDVVLKEDLPYGSKITIAVSNDGNGNFIEDLSNNAFSGFTFESEFWYFQTQRQLRITAASANRVYDGSALTNSTYSLTSGSLFEGEMLSSVTITGTQTNVGTSANVPSAAVIFDAENKNVTANYAIVYENGTLTIDSRPIKITAGSDTKVYDGTALTNNGYTISDGELAEGEVLSTVTVVGSQTYVGTSANVPSAAIILKGLVDVTANYDIAYENGMLEVTSRSIKIRADSGTKVYDGTALTQTGFSIISGTLADGETLPSVTITGTQTNVGASANLPKDAVLLDSEGEDVTYNYEITYQSGTLTVTRKILNLTANNDSKIYGEGYSFQGKEFTVDGLVQGDQVTSATLSSPGSAILAEVGLYPISIGNAVGTGLGNYDISYSSGTLEVKKRPLLINVKNSFKEFGSVDPVFQLEYEGFVNGDKAEDLEGSPVFSREEGEAVGLYQVEVAGLDAKNYSFEFLPGQLSIGKKILEIRVNSVQKVYGEKDPEFSVSFSEIVPESELEGTLQLERNPGENVGTYELWALGYTSSNYEIIYIKGKLDILPRPLFITSVDLGKTYGDPDPEFEFEVQGLLEGDEVSGKLSRDPGENVGRYKIIQGNVLVNNPNYLLEYIPGYLTIVPRILIIQPDPNQSKIFGESDPELSYRVKNLAIGDLKEAVLSGKLDRQQGEEVGLYPIGLGTIKSNSNYTLEIEPGVFEIKPKPVQIRVKSGNEKIYGETDPVLSLTDGSIEVLLIENKISLYRESGEEVGTYEIRLKFEQEVFNYVFTFENSLFTIFPRTLIIQPESGQRKALGTADPEKFAFTASNFAFQDNESILTGKLSRASGEGLGNYPFNKGTLVGNKNYILELLPGDFEIFADFRSLAITNVTVNEASPFAVFTVAGAAGQLVVLTLVEGSATKEDFGPGLEYFDGAKWVLYTVGTLVAIHEQGGLFVRTPIIQDFIFEGPEQFTLRVTNTGGTSAVGICTIKDDGTGLIFNPEGTENSTAVKDDDRPLNVNDITVNESSPFAEFTVSGAVGQLVVLALAEGTATFADFGPGLEYYNGTTWLMYTPGMVVALDQGGLLSVRTPIIQDEILEGVETFSLIVTNTGGTSATGVGIILDFVTVAKDDFASVRGTPGGTISVSGNVLQNDFNTGGDTIKLTAKLVTDPKHIPGKLVFTEDGSYTFTPAPGFSGLLEVAYTACGGDPFESCATATLYLEVLALVVPQPDVNATYLGIPLTGAAATNDNVPAGSSYGTPVADDKNPAGASIQMNPDGTYTFDAVTPGVYNYTVSVCAPDGICVSTLLTITVKERNEPSVPILKTDLGTVKEGAQVEINTLSNDVPGRNGVTLDPSTVKVTEQPKNGTVSVDPATGRITYTPNPGFAGKDVYTYSVCDTGNPALCATAIQEITVIGRDASNVIYAADDFVTGSAGTTLSGNVLLNDSDLLGGKLTVTSQEKETSQGNFKLNADGTFTFVPKLGFIGPVQLIYQVCTGGEDTICVNATLYLLIAPNELLAVMDNFHENEINGLEGGTAGNVLSNDLINNRPVKPSDVTIKVIENGGIEGVMIDNEGNIIIPKGTAPGTYVVTYSICDVNDPSNCSDAIIILEVFHGVNLRIFKDALTVNNFEGDQIEYIIRVENNGTTDAINVVVMDNLPNGSSYISSTVTGATTTTTISGQKITWKFAFLPVGSSVEILIRVKADALTDGMERSLTNTATVSSPARELSPKDNSSSARVLIKPFGIPNVITPNGDRKNDEFVINGLGKFSSNELIIFDRWGSHVYQKKGYQNDWSGEGLVAGTYFYILFVVDFKGVQTEFKGWIQLIRE